MGVILEAINRITVTEGRATLFVKKFKRGAAPEEFIYAHASILLDGRLRTVSCRKTDYGLSKEILRFINPKLKMKALKARATSEAMDSLMKEIRECGEKARQIKLSEIDADELPKMAREAEIRYARRQKDQNVQRIVYEVKMLLRRNPDVTISDLEDAWNQAQVESVLES